MKIDTQVGALFDSKVQAKQQALLSSGMEQTKENLALVAYESKHAALTEIFGVGQNIGYVILYGLSDIAFDDATHSSMGIRSAYDYVIKNSEDYDADPQYVRSLALIVDRVFDDVRIAELADMHYKDLSGENITVGRIISTKGVLKSLKMLSSYYDGLATKEEKEWLLQLILSESFDRIKDKIDSKEKKRAKEAEYTGEVAHSNKISATIRHTKEGTCLLQMNINGDDAIDYIRRFLSSSQLIQLDEVFE